MRRTSGLQKTYPREPPRPFRCVSPNSQLQLLGEAASISLGDPYAPPPAPPPPVLPPAPPQACKQIKRLQGSREAAEAIYELRVPRDRAREKLLDHLHRPRPPARWRVRSPPRMYRAWLVTCAHGGDWMGTWAGAGRPPRRNVTRYGRNSNVAHALVARNVAWVVVTVAVRMS